jgi:hypothetical protein
MLWKVWHKKETFWSRILILIRIVLTLLDCMYVYGVWNINAAFIFRDVFYEITLMSVSSWEDILWVEKISNGSSEIHIFAF